MTMKMITMMTFTITMMMMMTANSPTIEEGQVSVQHCQSQYWKFNIEKIRKRENIQIPEYDTLGHILSITKKNASLE